MPTLKLLLLGVCLFTCPPLYIRLARRWFPDEYGDADAAVQHLANARVLRKRFWGAFGLVVSVMLLVVLFRWWQLGAFPLNEGEEWLDTAVVVLALLAALGRGGREIESWKDHTVVERIDRGMYLVEQLGVAALLIFVITL